MTMRDIMSRLSELKKNSEDMTSLMKHQLYIVKASLATLNDKVSGMEFNK
jgi:hypothetical protein